MRLPHNVTARAIFALLMLASIAAFARVVGIASPWFGLVASFCVLGLLDLAMPVVQLRVPPSLRDVRSWEVRGGAYRAFGVPVFGAFLRGSPLRLLNQTVYLKAFPGDLMAVRTRIQNAEAAHFWGGLATLPYVSLAWIRGWWGTLIAVILFDLVANVYPILHLRSVRARIEQALQHKSSRQFQMKKV